MGITIDDARREMISGKPYTDKFAKALVVAIDTMRKYQKMLQVLSDWKAMGYNENDGLYSLLSRVVEDGNDDN